MIRLGLLFTFVLLLGCEQSTPPNPDPPDPGKPGGIDSIFPWNHPQPLLTLRGDSADIAETIMRKYLASISPATPLEAACLMAFWNGNLDSAFMGRFRDIAFPEVIPQAQCSSVNLKPIRKSDSASAIRISVDSLSWISTDSAEIRGGSMFAALGGGGCTFGLKKDPDRWEIRRQFDCWISTTSP